MAGNQAQQAYDFFISKGYPPTAAAAIVGNLSVESNFNPAAKGDYSNGTPTAFGIAQWRNDRVTAFQKFAGKDIRNSTFEDQLAFVDHELRNNYTNTYFRLREAGDVATATKIFMDGYERPNKNPAVNHIAKRIIAATSIASRNTLGEKAKGAIGDILRNIPIPGMPAVTTGNVADAATAGQAVATSAYDNIIRWVPRIIALLLGLILVTLAISALVKDNVAPIVADFIPKGT